MSKHDRMFWHFAQVAARQSKCLSRQIGAVIGIGDRLLATGYNGPPRGVPHCGERYNIDPSIVPFIKRDPTDPTICPRKNIGYKSGEGLHLCPAVHAEANAIINAAYAGVSTNGATLYLSVPLLPCKDCIGAIINSGITEIVLPGKASYDEQSKLIYEHSHIYIRLFEL